MPVPTNSRRLLRAMARLAAGTLAFLVVGNVAILGLSFLNQVKAGGAPPVEGVEGVDHLRAVDAKVWRGAHPTAEGYRALAANGVSTVVDLRAESDAPEAHADAEAAGLDVRHLPVRDGQVPSRSEIEQFLHIVEEADGTVFVHCGAGVGRTGAMSAAYLVATGQASPGDALLRNLAVGPPSLEQILFVRGLGDGEMSRPNPVLTVVSRFLDSPRRLLSRL